MVLMSPMVHEKVWLDKPRYDAAERRYYERLSQLANSSSESNVIDDPLATTANACALKPKEIQEENVCKRSNEQTCKKPSSQTAGKADVKEVKKDSQSSKSEKAKKRTETESKESVCQKAAQPSLSEIDEIAVTSNTVSVEVANRVVALEKENKELSSRMEKLEQKIAALEKQLAAASAANTTCAVPKKAAAPAPAPAKQSKDDDDDGVDLFGSDSEEEDAEAAKIKEQRLAEYAARKSKKPALIAKSSIVLDVKPWDDETDMKLLEQEVRKIACDGLLWGASKLVPLAYGIHKLQISCVVEDEKVSVDWLQETIQEIEDYVQSVDIAAFNKI